MHLPTKRPTMAIGSDSNNWAKFDNIEDSVEDWVLWWKMYLPTMLNAPVDKVVNYMKSKNYFEDSYENYLKGVKSWL